MCIPSSVPHFGLAGRADHVVWRYAFDHDFAVVTTNARDFIELLQVPVHPGLIVLRESGTEQAGTMGAAPSCCRAREELRK